GPLPSRPPGGPPASATPPPSPPRPPDAYRWASPTAKGATEMSDPTTVGLTHRIIDLLDEAPCSRKQAIEALVSCLVTVATDTGFIPCEEEAARELGGKIMKAIHPSLLLTECETLDR